MAKKEKPVDIKNQIKEMENQKREASVPKMEEDAMVSFDSWYHQRKDKIPKRHMKEIIMADFKARGLGLEATASQFDKALRLYGIKLDS